MADPVRPRHISAIDGEPEIKTDEKKVLDAGDPVQLKEAIKDAKSAEQVKKETVRNFMQVEATRKYIFDLLAACHIYHSPYSKFGSDQTHFNLGEHNIGLRVLADIQSAAPNLYLTMLEENKANG